MQLVKTGHLRLVQLLFPADKAKKAHHAVHSSSHQASDQQTSRSIQTTVCSCCFFKTELRPIKLERTEEAATRGRAIITINLLTSRQSNRCVINSIALKMLVYACKYINSAVSHQDCKETGGGSGPEPVGI